MIVAADTDFHERDRTDRTWTETTFLAFAVPEEQIFGNAYVLARPNLGVCLSSIIVSRGICRQPYEVDFTDPQMHLPCPQTFSKYTLENGLSVEGTNSGRDYHMTYENNLGACRFDLSFKGLHHPFDPHDPRENALLAQAEGNFTDPRMGDAWSNGHFQAHGHITGELELRGKTYKVDCYDGMDHSWGPRKEHGTRAVSWISINFGDSLCAHLAVPMNLSNGIVTYDAPKFGFIVENGVVHSIVEAKVSSEREDMLPLRTRIEVIDVRGQRFEFSGTAIGGHPWYTFNPCHTCFQVLMRYEYKGTIGYGEFGDIFGLDYLADRLSRSARHA